MKWVSLTLAALTEGMKGATAASKPEKWLKNAFLKTQLVTPWSGAKWRIGVKRKPRGLG